MRISKAEERWFEIPGDPDGGRLKIRHLLPGERAEVWEKAFPQGVQYRPDEKGKMAPEFNMKPDRKYDREETAKRAVKDWENFFDADGKALECTPENVVRAVNEIEGFTLLVNTFREQLSEDIAKEREDQEKNLSNSQNG